MKTRTFQEYHKEIMSQKRYGEDTFKDFIETCFKHCPDLLAIRLRGWTPSFNDGDPCYHSEDLKVLFRDDVYGFDWAVHFHEKYESICEEIFLIKATPSRWNEKEMHYGGMSREDIAALGDCPKKRVLYAIRNQFYAEHAYGTDYELIIDRTEEGTDIEYRQYECGY